MFEQEIVLISVCSLDGKGLFTLSACMPGIPPIGSVLVDEVLNNYPDELKKRGQPEYSFPSERITGTVCRVEVRCSAEHYSPSPGDLDRDDSTRITVYLANVVVESIGDGDPE